MATRIKVFEHDFTLDELIKHPTVSLALETEVNQWIHDNITGNNLINVCVTTHPTEAGAPLMHTFVVVTYKT